LTAASSEPVRVLHLCPDTQHLRELFNLYRQALDEAPFESTVVFLRGAADPVLAQQFGSRVTFLDLPRRALGGLRLPALWRLWRWARTQPRFDLVIAHRFKPLTLGLALRRVGAARRVFGVVHELGQFAGLRRGVIERARASSLTLICVSEAVRADLRRRFPALAPGLIRALPNAVPERALRPREQALAALGLSPERFWFGSIGRLAPIKGHDALLRAFAPLARDLPQVGLALIGAGREEESLRTLCAELGIAARVTFCGWHDDARSLLGAIDVCVFASHEEGFGLAVVEAMAAGRPVITPAVGALPEVVGDCALLVPPHDQAALEVAMRRLVGDAALRETMGATLHARWRDHFSSQRFIDSLRGLAREATGACL
jgi:glycosyltransferase involved in cell wall biosynthesis